MNKVKVQIIGGSGFLGKILSKYLCFQGYEVIAYGRRKPESLNCEFKIHDIMKDFVKIEHGVDIIFYLSQAQEYRNFPQNLSQLNFINTIAPIHYAIEADRCGVKQFFYASTGNVYRPSFLSRSEADELFATSPYAASKLAAEQYLNWLDIEMSITSLRIFGLFGEGQQNMLPYILKERVLNNLPVMLNLLDQYDASPEGLIISFLYVKDAVDILFKLCERAIKMRDLPSAINIAGQYPISIYDFSMLIGNALKKKVWFEKETNYLKHHLIANISLLRKIISPKFTKTDQAISMSFMNKEIVY